MLVIMFREVDEEHWQVWQVAETRVQALIDGGWHILIGEDDIRRQMIEDEFQQQTERPPFNGLRRMER